MPYEKHTWQTGETITAEKLNNIEEGINTLNAGGCLYIEILSIDSENNTATLSKTFEEINNAFHNNLNIVLSDSSEGYVYQLTYMFPDYVYGWNYSPPGSLSTTILNVESDGSVYYEYSERS